MTYPDIKLVDAPVASASVLFDFNDETASPSREVLADEFSIGTPELIGDVDAIDPLYGERMVTFTCRMTGTKAEVASAQSTLARRLLASGQGWLQVQLTPTSRLLFFRTYRPQPGDLSFDLVQGVATTKRESWEIDVAIPCEPFAYGERVTQPAQVISNDPGSGANRLNILVPEIIGDAPTSLRIVAVPSASQVATRWLATLTSTPSPRGASSFGIGAGDTFTELTDTSTTVSDGNYSGGTARVTTFANNNLVARLQAVISVRPNRYKVMARIGGSAAAQWRIQAQFGVISSGVFSANLKGPIVSSAPHQGSANSVTTAQWVSLGDLSLPFNINPTSMLSTLGVQLHASRISGTGNLYWDHLMLVPVGTPDSYFSLSQYTTMTSLSSSLAVGPSNPGTWDGDSSLFWTAPGGVMTEIRGSFLIANPGNVHNLYLFLRADDPNAFGSGDLLDTTTSVTISYLPRFLYVGDS